LPDAKAKHEVFWASVVNIGDNLQALESGLEERAYQTKTRGTYEMLYGRFLHTPLPKVNVTLNLPVWQVEVCTMMYTVLQTNHSLHQNATRLTSRITFLIPLLSEKSNRIQNSSSFVLQVKNRDAPSAPQVGLNPEKKGISPARGKA
jgi:hypothetical protein